MILDRWSGLAAGVLLLFVAGLLVRAVLRRKPRGPTVRNHGGQR